MEKNILEQILNKVQKPSRYIGEEVNFFKKEWDRVKIHMALVFPDLYEIGMSHLGLMILYGLVNEREDCLLERVFMPAEDMKEELRKKKLSLFSWESRRPLRDFDIVGFTLQHELSYTNVLEMLYLSSLPLFSCQRTEKDPLIIAGGPLTANPEPMAPFIDCFLIGDGEELLPEFLDVFQKKKHLPKEDLLMELAVIPGVYIPAFYSFNYDEGKIVGISSKENVAFPVRRRILKELDEAYFPLKPVIPYTQTVHDRAMLEVMRGCTHGCRFCQAGSFYRPVREKSPALVKEQALKLINNTGYDELSLLSLSSADYRCIYPLVQELGKALESRKTSIALPSLRMDSFSVKLATEIQKVRRSTLTFAPEAGSQRMRDIINKNLSEEEILNCAAMAFEAGWKSIKLYFMIGLPQETNEDLEAIAALTDKILKVNQHKDSKKAKVNLSISSFIPKAQTPFQWEAQNSRKELKQKQQFLAHLLPRRAVNYSFQNVDQSFLEAVLARGDRRQANLIYNAWLKGAKMDGWDEYFAIDRWQEAAWEKGIDLESYAEWQPAKDEIFPWDHLDLGVSKEFLLKEWEKAKRGRVTEDCREGFCAECTVCERFDVENIIKEWP